MNDTPTLANIGGGNYPLALKYLDKDLLQDMNALAKYFGIAVLNDLNSFLFVKELGVKMPYPFVKKHCLIPLVDKDGKLIIAISHPLNLDAIEEVRQLLDRSVEVMYCPSDIIITAIDKNYHQEEGATSRLIQDLSQAVKSNTSEDVESLDLLDDREKTPIVKLLNFLIQEAVCQGASDIHFEPYEDRLRVRYRIDGVLQNRHAPPPEYRLPLLTRIKVMAKLDIAEHRLPQDGRIKLKLGGKEIDFRISTIPISESERIVMRILDRKNITLGLNTIGMGKKLLCNFRDLIRRPEGIVLVTGPTGSGKTTTLYSAISEIYSESLNIMTIEDPVEYKLPGIAQMGVHAKINLDFSRGLRHILRQDPDVIMIGEIRDLETAEIAIQASLTGHLVVSTLHTNDAPSAITRLVDMGIEPYLLSSSVIGVLAQRLVRKICLHCKVSYEPSSEECSEVRILKGTKAIMFAKGLGCEHCFGTGYKDRHGVYELMVISSSLKRQMMKTLDHTKLKKLALKEGMFSLHTHGSELVLAGITTVTELLRVTKETEEEG